MLETEKTELKQLLEEKWSDVNRLNGELSALKDEQMSDKEVLLHWESDKGRLGPYKTYYI
jgi:hypothetical protein